MQDLYIEGIYIYTIIKFSLTFNLKKPENYSFNLQMNNYQISK